MTSTAKVDLRSILSVEPTPAMAVLCAAERANELLADILTAARALRRVTCGGCEDEEVAVAACAFGNAIERVEAEALTAALVVEGTNGDLWPARAEDAATAAAAL